MEAASSSKRPALQPRGTSSSELDAVHGDEHPAHVTSTKVTPETSRNFPATRRRNPPLRCAACS